MKKFIYSIILILLFNTISFAGPTVLRSGVKTMPPFKIDQNVETLSANKTLTISDKTVQKLDPNGSDTTVILPTEALSKDLIFWIYNNANGNGEEEDLLIEDNGGSTIVILRPGIGMMFSCNGTEGSWVALNSNAYDELQMIVVDFTTDMETGDGKFYFHIGQKLNGMVLGYCHANNITAGTGTGTDTTDIQIHNLTQSEDMLSTVLTIDEDELGSDEADTPYIIWRAHAGVTENDILRIDVDAVTPTTAPKGLILTLGFGIPFPL